MRSNCSIVKVLVLAFGLVLWESVGAEVLQNAGLSISFADAAEGYSIRSIVNRLEGEARFVNCVSGQAGLWRLEFVGRGAAGTNEFVSADNLANAASRRVERSGEKLQLVFEGVDLGDERGVLDVRAEIELSRSAPASRWRISIVSRSTRYALYRTFYPLLRTVVQPGKADALLPHSILGGKLKRAWSGTDEDLRCAAPGWRTPLAAFNLGESGLYVAAHDPQQRFKYMVFGKGTDVWFDTTVEDAGVPGKAAEGPRYPVVIAAYRGDWWDAAKIYRNWARKQKWTAKGPIATRADFPKAMADTDIWVRFNEPSAAAVSNNIVQMKRIWPDFKVGVHWYCWHNSDFDVNFPEFFPARRGVKDVVRFGRANGYVMMPYVDFRLWDEDLASWPFVRDDALVRFDGSLYEEIYFTKRRLAIMCPTERLGRVADKITHDAIDADTANGCAFNGLYYDQTACSWGPPCWNAKHGHPLGGGAWWWKRHREILRPLHDLCASKNIPITSEGTGEMFLDLIDGYLGIGALPQEDDVPLHPALYSGYAVYFGSCQSLRDPIGAFHRFQAQSFVRGIVPGWFDRYNIASPEFVRQQQYLASIVRMRRAAKEFMVYGTLENEIRTLEPQETADCRIEQVWRPQYSATWKLPDVFGTVWKTIDGKATAVIAANAGEKSRTIRFKAPAKGLKAVPVEGIAPAGAEEGDGVVTLTIPPLGFAYLKTF